MSLKINVVQGDDVNLIITVKDKTGTVINLTGITAATFTAKQAGASSASVTKTLGSGVGVTSAVGGILTISLTDTDTAAMAAGKHFFEIQITDSSGAISTVRDFDDYAGELVILADLD